MTVSPIMRSDEVPRRMAVTGLSAAILMIARSAPEVGAHQFGLVLRLVGHRDDDLLGLLHDVGVRDDVPLGADDDARAEAAHDLPLRLEDVAELLAGRPPARSSRSTAGPCGRTWWRC